MSRLCFTFSERRWSRVAETQVHERVLLSDAAVPTPLHHAHHPTSQSTTARHSRTVAHVRGNGTQRGAVAPPADRREKRTALEAMEVASPSKTMIFSVKSVKF